MVDELVSKLRSEEDETRIAELARGLQKQVYGLQPIFFLGDTGTVMGLRRDSMQEMRAREDGSWLPRPPAVERSGLYSSRPWWVRVDAVEPDEEGAETEKSDRGGTID